MWFTCNAASVQIYTFHISSIAIFCIHFNFLTFFCTFFVCVFCLMHCVVVCLIRCFLFVAPNCFISYRIVMQLYISVCGFKMSTICFSCYSFLLLFSFVFFSHLFSSIFSLISSCFQSYYYFTLKFPFRRHYKHIKDQVDFRNLLLSFIILFFVFFF